MTHIIVVTNKMADKKTTSNSGLFGQSFGGDLDFSQFSGPKLFTPAPIPAPVDTYHQKPNVLQDTAASHVNAPRFPATPAPPQPFGNISLEGPSTLGNVSFPPATSPPSMPFSPNYSNQQVVNNLPHQAPPPMGHGNVSSRMTPIQTFTPSSVNTSNQFLTGPMVPPSSIPPAQTFTPVYKPRAVNEHTQQTVSTPMSAPGLAGTMSPPAPNTPYLQPQQAHIPPPTTEPLKQTPDLPDEYNISPFASTANQHNANPIQQTAKVTPHWYFLRKWTVQMPFYKVLSEWMPFSKIDSHKLEHEFLLHKANRNIIHTDGGRYDVDLSKMSRKSVYWSEEETEVRRCTWFYKEENKFVPYEPQLAEKLEDQYLEMMSKGIFNIRVDLSESSFVLFHNPSVLVQYNTNQDMEWTGEDSKARPKVVRRGISEEESMQIAQGEEGPVKHIVFVVHGIGPVADLRMRSIVECVDDLRKNSLQFSNNQGFAMQGGPVDRVEFFPIQWYSSVRDDKFGIDKQLESLTLPSITKLRNFTNETLTDILFFTSPVYCQAICDTVVSEMNRIYKLFKSRNPSFNGKASICGHSLGSVISFDILANQGMQNGSANHDSSEMYEDCGEVVEETIQPKSQGPVSRSSPNTSAMSSLNSSINDMSMNDGCQTIHDVLNKLNLLALEKQFAEEQIDLDTLTMCQEGDLRDLGIPFGPRKKLMAYMKQSQTQSPSSNSLSTPSSTTLLVSNPLATRGTQTPTKVGGGGNALSPADSAQFSFKTSHAGTGQPLVTYKQLEFETENLFALGSPIGLFLTCRGVSNIGLKYKLPKCDAFMNIFHPYDPVVYRLEPLINETIDIPPVLIPHHKGRKRFHLEIKENLSRVSAKVKSGFMNAMNMTWTSINDFARSHQSDYQPAQLLEEEDKEKVEAEHQEELARKAMEDLLDFGRLNGGKRIDFVLQEKPFEILNEYLFALGSHTCYWTSEDVALLMLKKIYKANE